MTLPLSSSATIDIGVMAARVPSTMVIEGTDHHVRPIIAGTSYLAKLILQSNHDMSHGSPQQVIGRTKGSTGSLSRPGQPKEYQALVYSA
ncbi:MAG: hypothetical protein GY696_07385 [Gammaproteobacteria bacterium]|nr:hypothetical protein [Gammaproteobacteria bacterium]